jgi:hypothetical protein
MACDRLAGSTPIITAVTAASVTSMDGEAGQSYLERSRPLLNHDPPGTAAGENATRSRATQRTWAST